MLRLGLITSTAILILTLFGSATAVAQDEGPVARPPGNSATDPTALRYPAAALDIVPVVNVPALDLDALRQEDEQRDRDGLAPRFAVPHPVDIRPGADGVWDQVDPKTVVWQLRIASPGALSLNFGFTRYRMPAYGRLLIYAADLSEVIGPFTAADNEDHGELWTPVILSDDVVLEVTVPAESAAALELVLGSINVGYRGFGELASDDRAGACNIDVICSQGDLWRDQIRSVGVISTGGSAFCTGFLVNNTALDKKPYFMTANHCGINSGNAASLVVYWNFQSPTCGQHGGGSLSQYQTGSYFRATYSTSDFTLVELDDAPAQAFNVYLSGWDRTTADPTSAVCIHHPNCDEKSISFDYQTCPTTSYLGSTSPGDGTHIKTDWDLGVTEPGSSGSPLFNQDHRIVGQLHGGYSACGSSDMRDWYGRFSRSWTGGGTSATRLSNWLDPGSTGATTLDGLNYNQLNGIQVTPAANFESSGEPGGPFTPGSLDYTVKNIGTTSLNYQVTKTQSWLTLTNASGSLAGGASVIVNVSVNANANSLGLGVYTDTITFTDLTAHQGDTTRTVTLRVGGPHLVYSWNMDTNPGWTISGGQWAWGTPTGGGGSYGKPDPTAGYTGTKVYGYNLSGDYAANIPEYHLTTGAINCSNLSTVSLRFWRWLGVERSSYDHAYVRVSNNGTTWTTLWSNPDSETADAAWTFQQFDISAYADGKPTVYIRWTMGSTDGSWQYCGWNIDDVEIWGVQTGVAPAITQQPQSQSVCVGASASFTVAASGTSPLSYQWRKGGSNIAGATSSSYTINPVGTSDAGSYDCVVTNAYGAATSNAAALTVASGPAIAVHPVSQTVRQGQSVSFAVTATGTAPLSYQWRKDGLSISGATASSYAINPVSPGDAGSYDCVVSNGCGSATSNSATLTVWRLGDLNCDGLVNNQDIDHFVQALIDAAGYLASHDGDPNPPCDILNGDFDGDGLVNNQDIDGFVAALFGG